MMMAAETEGRSSNSVSVDGVFRLDDDRDDIYIDLDLFNEIMGDGPGPSQGGTEESQLDIVPAGSLKLEVGPSSNAEFSQLSTFSPSSNSEVSNFRTGPSRGSSDSAGNSIVLDGGRYEQPFRHDSPVDSFSGRVSDRMLPHGHDHPHTYNSRNLQNASSFFQDGSKTPSLIRTFSFAAPGASHSTDNRSSDFSHLNHEEDLLIEPMSEDAHSEYFAQKQFLEENDLTASMSPIEESTVMDGDRSSQDVSHADSSFCQIPEAGLLDGIPENGNLQFSNSGYPSYFVPSQPDFCYNSRFKSFSGSNGLMNNVMDQWKNKEWDASSTTAISYNNLVGNSGAYQSTDHENSEGLFSNGRFPSTKLSDMHMENNIPRQKEDNVKNEKKNGSVTSTDIVSRASEVIGDVISRKFYRGPIELSANRGAMASSLAKNHMRRVKNEKEGTFSVSKRPRYSPEVLGGAHGKYDTIVSSDSYHLRLKDQPGVLPSTSIKQQPDFLEEEKDPTKFSSLSLPDICHQGVQGSTLNQSYNIDDDFDVCIIEEMSAPARINQAMVKSNAIVAPQFSTFRDPIYQVASGYSRVKQDDERFIFRAALQDLSQPKSEATPPDGVLAVPLLRHQRIALSWMVKKETSGDCCSGGILADDQGLGKTISTIALILKERSPSSKASATSKRQMETETLDLDDDDDGVFESTKLKQELESYEVGAPISSSNRHAQVKGKPAAGTLIVCPTSVLRQWSDELHNKVTKEADLSVLVYHGSNRTKDPFELAKYDVVITTYSIVSMEVPKQPLVNEDDDEIGTSFKGSSYSKNKKGCSNKKSAKSKKGIDSELVEAMAGTLAKVAWFRVVLDEAQSIKNHRTQVARACWGLRAKRRWCLSGTPIQNAIDDLYSYFRFLRYDPYAIFKLFCRALKVPIHRNPSVGYKKLQAVLKTIMLRRTKGTLIDGKPIISLPPKTIELRRVDFTLEERDFYCTLEADSRAQFAEYAAAGTVKQNYVNILLMLLRLRQACDHPFLVNGINSNSRLNSSIDMAKNLPREKQTFLLKCLEASMAICGICSDPPEDAVVTICGHVFCNQCISEHLTGDDTHCPATSCKTRLNVCSLFSITTLRSSLSGQHSMGNTPDSFDSELNKESESFSLGCTYESSKIKAALQALQSLSKGQNGAARACSSVSTEEAHCSEDLHGHDSSQETENSKVNRSTNDSVVVGGEKAIVFSQWTRMLDLLEARLKDSCIPYRRLDGTMSVAARDKAVKDFNTIPEVSVMIMSLKAASLGLNMVAACRVVLLDLWWNPTTEDQAIDRAHRIGQTRPVSVLRLTVKDTVEDRILALQQKKREMVASAFGEDETGSRQTRLTVDDLKYLFMMD